MDIQESTARKRAKEWGADIWLTDYKELLKMEEIDAVDICLPHHLHARVAIAALEAGKHVLLEKPIATTLADADEILSVARRAGVKFMIAENVRFIPAHRLMKKLIDEGLVGRIFLARSHQGGSEIRRLMDPQNWKGTPDKCGGGVLIDSGVHRIDLFRWILGDVKAVYAWIAKQVVKLENKCEDNALLLLKFKNQAIGELDTSWTIVSPWNETVEIYGTKGTILVDLSRGLPLALYSEEMGNYWHHPRIEHSPTNWGEDSIRKEVQHFVDCILKDEEPEVKGEDGRTALEVALAAYESARTGKIVELPLSW